MEICCSKDTVYGTTPSVTAPCIYTQKDVTLSCIHLSSAQVTLVVSTNCRSAGEALRLIDQKDIIKADFVLVSGDTVANMDLAAVLAQHKARRARDKNAIMTMVSVAPRPATEPALCIWNLQTQIRGWCGHAGATIHEPCSMRVDTTNGPVCFIALAWVGPTLRDCARCSK